MKLKLSTVTRHLSLVTNKLSLVTRHSSLTMVLTIFLSAPLVAQVTIGENKEPHKFSVLEISTANVEGGLRLSQLTTQQRNALVTAPNTVASGLVIYNTDTNCLEFWNSNVWISLCDNSFGTLEVSPKNIIFTAHNAFTLGSTEDITVTTDQPSWTWSVTGVDASHFKVEKTGNNKLTVSPTSDNTGAMGITATVIISTKWLSETVTLRHNPKPSGSSPNLYVGTSLRAEQTDKPVIQN